MKSVFMVVLSPEKHEKINDEQCLWVLPGTEPLNRSAGLHGTSAGTEPLSRSAGVYAELRIQRAGVDGISCCGEPLVTAPGLGSGRVWYFVLR